MPARRKSTKAGKGKYTLVSDRPRRCIGCGVLCANTESLNDHQRFCDAAQEAYELTPLRDAVFVRGDIRGYK
jgi:hypothetical protein